jgi:hypothetical protein
MTLFGKVYSAVYENTKSFFRNSSYLNSFVFEVVRGAYQVRDTRSFREGPIGPFGANRRVRSQVLERFHESNKNYKIASS